MSRSSDDEGPPTTIGYAPALQADSREVAAPPEITAAPGRAVATTGKATFRVAESDLGVRWIAKRIDEAVAEILRGRATVFPADVSPRPRKEMDPWREEANPSERSDRTDTTSDGESSWSQQEAKRLLRTTRAKKKHGRSSGR